MFRRSHLMALLLLCGLFFGCTGKNAEDANPIPKPDSSGPADLKTPSNPIQTEPPVALVPGSQQKAPVTEGTSGDMNSTPLPMPTPTQTADAAIPVPATVGLAEVQIPALQEQTTFEEKVLPVLSQVNTDRDSTEGTSLTDALSTPLPAESSSEPTFIPSVPLESTPTATSPSPAATESPTSISLSNSNTPAPTDSSSEATAEPSLTTTSSESTSATAPAVETSEESKTSPPVADTEAPTSTASTPKDSNEDSSDAKKNESSSSPDQDTSHGTTNESDHEKDHGNNHVSEDPEQEIVIKADCKGKKTAVIKLMDSRKDKSEKISVQCIKDSAIIKMTVKKKDIPFIRIETTAM